MKLMMGIMDGNIRCRIHKRPDIRVKKLVLSDERTEFEIWDILEARATSLNDGGEPFQDVSVRWYLDNIHIADDNMRHWNIENGDEKHESVNLVNLAVGSHIIKTCADFEDDDNDDNNCLEITFEVSEPEEPPTPGDFNGDRLVNSSDYSILLSNFGQSDCGNSGC